MTVPESRVVIDFELTSSTRIEKFNRVIEEKQNGLIALTPLLTKVVRHRLDSRGTTQ